MMGLLFKAAREIWLTTLLLGMALMAVEALLTFILPQFQTELSEVWLQMPFVKSMISALIGVEIDGEITSQMMQSILWVHPVVLALLWAHEMIVCTRVPAGEVDRGTIDLLLGLPVSRRAVYGAETLAWLGSGATMLLLGITGHLLLVHRMPDSMRPDLLQISLILVNMYALYVAVGGVSLLVSSLSDRRGRAISIVLAIVLASFLLNFLAQFWSPAERLAFLSVLDYYQPAVILRERALPVGDVLTLAGVGLVTWGIGGEVMARRGLCTV